jgi:2-amino-4-hydroxy-6-hydroxymethyldihydropteridine diphosphokinase
LQYIEQETGRIPSPIVNAPRLIDLDIIYAGNLQINEAHLTIPHPRWHTRRFVLQPLSDIRPDLIILGQNKTVMELLNSLKDNHTVKLFTGAKQW